MGCVYRPKKSRFSCIKYYTNGTPRYESARTTKRTEAERLLREREGRIARGELVLPRVDRIRYEEVAADLRVHYRTTGRRELGEAERRLKHLDRFFRGSRVAAITEPEIAQYVAHRQEQGAAGGTINRELATLRRLLGLAYEQRKLVRVPIVRKLKEAAPRAGFFEREQFEAVRACLPPDLRVAVCIAYTFGWRLRSEVLVLERRQVDLGAGTVRLDAGHTKNDDGRLVYLPPDLHAQLGEQIERVRALERETGRITPWLFPHLSGPRRGEPRRDFRKAWLGACKRAGVSGMLRHDFRRTAVRNLVNAGVPERVAMTISGHRTRSVFDRYHIVSPTDLKAATQRLEDAKAEATVRKTVIPLRGASE